eukprot:scaffold16436_cov47-Cyclotella_meneghiniana.AAC.3
MVLKCQVDWPSGAGAITAAAQHPRKLEGRLDKTSDPEKNKSPKMMARPPHYPIHISCSLFIFAHFICYTNRDNR